MDLEPHLPVHEALPALRQALAAREAAVLVAPPGAGKTTVVPLALLDEPWVGSGKLIVLEPRRLAARAAAARMASTLGERVGETVGFRVRMESKVSARTRIEVVTEGVFTRMILDDPGLEGVAAVLFDEFHERSLDADLGLALARDGQGLLRPDLKLLVMSATLDGARVSALLGDAPVVESHGRAFSVETRYLGRDPAERLEAQVAKAVRRALSEESGGVLVFLPGQGEIRRTGDMLADRLPADVDLAPLYGALPPGEQDRAIAPAAPGRRKVVLATAIAETSLTLQGVRVVIDAGLSRVPRYDPASGLTRLETVRVNRAAADQRRGRAGRTQPGVAYRLWDEAETRALTPFDRPEILEADLSGFALDLADWGATSPEGLAFLDAPPATAWREARALLAGLEALDGEGRLTAHGRLLANLPLPPRLAHMVARGAERGEALTAARIAVLLGERGLGGNSADIEDRLTNFTRDRSERARQAQGLAERWARLAGGKGGRGGRSPGALLLAAYPERAAKARGKAGEFRLTTGRAVFVEPTDALARADWIVAADLGGGAQRDRVLLAARIEEAEVIAGLAHRIRVETRIDLGEGGKATAYERTVLDRLMLAEKRIDKPSPALLARAQLDQVRRGGVGGLRWGEAAQSFRQRVAFMAAVQGEEWPDLSDDALLADLETWLEPLILSAGGLDKVSPADLDGAIRARVPYPLQQRLDKLAPTRFVGPTGDSFGIDYAAGGGPRVEVRVQALYGLNSHPTLAEGRVPLTLVLTSPAHRPVQMTRDLPGFWAGSWKDVRTEMRGRYPKHPWPENPALSTPTLRAKPRGT
jgi:ATP-dependent helicase HrpB